MAVGIFSNHIAAVFLAIKKMLGDMLKVKCIVDTTSQLKYSPYGSERNYLQARA
jgi:hypothetical protein